MKQALFLLVLVTTAAPYIHAQSDTVRLGKIVYFEGKVEVGADPRWSPVRINSAVRGNQFIRTSADGLAEVLWNNGNKSIVGPASRLSVKVLHASSASSAKARTEGTFSNFKTMFNATAATKRTEEGGIRRSKVESTESRRTEVYWKQDQEISFTEAFAIYEAGDYGRAIPALQAFLNQKPKDEMARYAAFALGHSYVMSNNNEKAREIFERFRADYSGDPLAAEAEKVLTEL